MQLMIDTADSPELLALASKFLNDAAKLGKVVAPRIVDDVPEGTVPVRPAHVEPIAPVPSPSLAAVIPPPPPAVVIPPPPPASNVTSAAEPPAAIPTTGTVSTAGELDKRGFPHDARIHSSPPSIRKGDGQWRGRRGLDNATLETVEAELRAKGYGVAVPPAPVIPPPPAVSDAPVTIPPPPPANTSTPASPPVIPPPPPPATGQPQGVPQGNQVKPLFAQLVDRVAALRKVPVAPEILTAAYTEVMGKPAALQDFHGAKDRIPALLERLANL
jgi:hypothetical protein